MEQRYSHFTNKERKAAQVPFGPLMGPLKAELSWSCVSALLQATTGPLHKLSPGEELHFLLDKLAPFLEHSAGFPDRAYAGFHSTGASFYGDSLRCELQEGPRLCILRPRCARHTKGA